VHLTLFGSIWAAKSALQHFHSTQPSRSPTQTSQPGETRRRVHVLLTIQYLFHDISPFQYRAIMARLSGIAQPAGMGKTATGLGGKGLGKSTAKRHRYGLNCHSVARWVTLLMMFTIARSCATTFRASRKEVFAV
jgi:hypothetical protein